MSWRQRFRSRPRVPICKSTPSSVIPISRSPYELVRGVPGSKCSVYSLRRHEFCAPLPLQIDLHPRCSAVLCQESIGLAVSICFPHLNIRRLLEKLGDAFFHDANPLTKAELFRTRQ